MVGDNFLLGLPDQYRTGNPSTCLTLLIIVLRLGKMNCVIQGNALNERVYLFFDIPTFHHHFPFFRQSHFVYFYCNCFFLSGK